MEFGVLTNKRLLPIKSFILQQVLNKFTPYMSYIDQIYAGQ